jgi:hypothetical protein
MGTVTARADTEELEEMVDDVVTGLALKRANHRIKPTLGEFGNVATGRTDDAVGMVLATEDVPMTIVNPVDALHNTDVGEQFESAEQTCIAEGVPLFAQCHVELGCAE